MYKMQDYTEYVEEHISLVREVWYDLKPNLRGLFSSDAITEIGYLIQLHDQSKFSRQEIDGYCQWYFPKDKRNRSWLIYNIAWNHHQKANPHHWQYWLMYDKGQTIALDMPVVYLVEMLCDWTAMSYKFKDTPGEFYEKNKDEMLLSDRTRAGVVELLPILNKLAEARRAEDE